VPQGFAGQYGWRAAVLAGLMLGYAVIQTPAYAAEPAVPAPTMAELTHAADAVRERNASQADIRIIARAAHAGNGQACELVAWMLATGTVVQQDRRLAFSWYVEAYRRGLRQSLHDAKIVFDRMNLDERASVDTRLLVFLRNDPPPPGAFQATPGHQDSAIQAGVKELIREEAARAAFPPQLAEAVAYVESRFTPDAVSSKGARGVMQIMPSTAAGLNTDADALFDARTNVRLGIQYLQQLVDQYGSYDRALAHYVGGYAAANSYPFVTDEVRSYVDNVLAQTQRYQAEPLIDTPRPTPAPKTIIEPGPRLAAASSHPHTKDLSKEDGRKID